MDTQEQNEGSDALKVWCDENGYDDKFYKSLKDDCSFEDPSDLTLLSDKDFDSLCEELGLKFGKKIKFKKQINLLKEKESEKKNKKNNENINNKKDMDDEKNPGSQKKNQGNVSISLKGVTEYEKFPVGQEKDEFFVMASLRAPYFEPEDRTPIDLVCVVDTSGSMSGERIKLVKQTLTFIVKNLTSSDRFACVTFSDTARTVVGLNNMNDYGRQSAVSLIDNIRAGGSTALCAGLVRGIELLKQRKKKDKIASVMLFTDGAANVGPSSAAEIMNQVKQAQEAKVLSFGSFFGSSEGESELPVINTFGFGSGHREELLESISQKGGGMYAYIENTNLIGETFAQCLGGLVSVIGKNLKVTLEVVDDRISIIQNLSKNTYKSKIIKSGMCVQLEIPDMQSEERRDLVFTLKIPKEEIPVKDFVLCKMSLDYINVATQKNENIVALCTIERSANDVDIGLRNFDLDLQHNRVEAAKAMDEADVLADSNNLDAARNRLTKSMDMIRKSRSGNDKFCLGLVSDLQKCFNKLKNKHDYSMYGKKMLYMNKAAHGKQRAVQSNAWSGHQAYCNNNQMDFMSNWSSSK